MSFGSTWSCLSRNPSQRAICDNPVVNATSVGRKKLTLGYLVRRGLTWEKMSPFVVHIMGILLFLIQQIRFWLPLESSELKLPLPAMKRTYYLVWATFSVSTVANPWISRQRVVVHFSPCELLENLFPAYSGLFRSCGSNPRFWHSTWSFNVFLIPVRPTEKPLLDQCHYGLYASCSANHWGQTFQATLMISDRFSPGCSSSLRPSWTIGIQLSVADLARTVSEGPLSTLKNAVPPEGRQCPAATTLCRINQDRFVFTSITVNWMQ